MSTSWKLCRMLFLAGFFLSSGCATTELLNVWRDPAYTGTPRNIMVIGVMANREFKIQFEEEFARSLKERGIGAVAGSSVLPGDSKLEKDVIAAKMKDIGADTVVITRVVDKRTIESMASQASVFSNPNEWYGFYALSYANMHASVMATTETNIYDLKTERRIWTAVSDTWVEGSEDNLFLVQTFVPVIMKRLVKEKIIK